MSNHYEFKMGMYLGELQQPFEQSLATARDLGAHYVWCGTHSNNRSLYELADAEIDQAAEQVAAHGLEFSCSTARGCSRQYTSPNWSRAKCSNTPSSRSTSPS